ncbi:hypothetical protein F5Y12DRAFT_28714 [Xylaria sp. FL1777]|nr:hypothetical protein F5Y12DRAFT_28714 [Xylaria sp. FL1777]
MASELVRPPTRTGSGSRPPTSRFQEGSMNDRTSAAPPAQFMGPEQLKEYENQFYAEGPLPREARRPRPFSAAAVYQHASVEEPQLHEHHQNRQRPPMTHKKSTSFFGRVRDALFHRGGGGQHGHTSKQQELRRKHSSLQEPLQHPLPPPPPRPDYHMGRTQSEVNIAQMFPNPRGGADRPSREDVMASYNQLVASGFFQSHAIQSTRHAAPAAASGGRQTPVLPMDHQAAPRPPLRIPSSISTTTRSGSVSPMPRPLPSPNPFSRNSREYATATMAAPAAPRSSLSSLFRPSIPDLHTKDSWYTLRGRKRTRDNETPTPEPQLQHSSTATSSAGYFAQPLKKVARKLREMPSSSSQLSSEASNMIKHAALPPRKSSRQATTAAADGVVRLVPSISFGGSVHPNERPIRLRSPSPEVMMTTTITTGDENERRRERPLPASRERAPSGTRRPRQTFSYTLTEPARGRTRTVERERESRGRERDVYRVQRRGSSSARPDSKTRTSSKRSTPQPQNPLGQWQRVSLEDTMIHRDSMDSARGWGESERENERADEWTRAGARKTTHSPLQTMSDANRRSGSGRTASKAPERWHGTGKAYHLKDRGSRPDLAVRRSEDGRKASATEGRRQYYGKENGGDDADTDWRRADADGDVDVLVYETRGRGLRDTTLYGQQQQQQQQGQQENQPQWFIGNAL